MFVIYDAENAKRIQCRGTQWIRAAMNFGHDIEPNMFTSK